MANPFMPHSARAEIESIFPSGGSGGSGGDTGLAGSSLFAGPSAPASLGAGSARVADMSRLRSRYSGLGSGAGGPALASSSRPPDGIHTPPLADGRVSPSGSLSAADNTLIGGTTTVLSSKAKAKQAAKSDTLMFRAPLAVATVTVHGSNYTVHSDLLCRESEYFKGCLRGSFSEAETQTVVIDDEDISVDDFGLWVDLLYRVYFSKPGAFVLRKEEMGGTLSTMQLLTLWKLSDRFLNKPLAAIVHESLQHRLGLYSVQQWRKLYRTRPAQDIKSRVSRLQDAYRYCCEQSLPFTDDIVDACANCPPQVYDSSVAILDKEFMEQVSRRMIMAHADTTLLSKEQRTASAFSLAGGDHIMGGTLGAVGSERGNGNGNGNGLSRSSGIGSGAVAGRAAGGFGSL